MGLAQQAVLHQPVDQLVQHGLHFHQHQRVEVVQQPRQHAHAIGGRHHRHGVVLLGQRLAHHRPGGREGIDARDDRRRDALVQALHGTGQVAEGGIGAGVTFHQKEHVLPRLQPRQHGLRRLQPRLAQLLGIVGHGKDKRLMVSHRLDAGPPDNAEGVAFAVAASHRIDPAGVAPLQFGPGSAGDHHRITGAEGNADQAAKSVMHGARILSSIHGR